jgi:hypothetical protein
VKSTEQLLSGFVEEGIASLRFWNLMCLRIELTPRKGKKTLVFLTEYIVQFDSGELGCASVRCGGFLCSI